MLPSSTAPQKQRQTFTFVRRLRTLCTSALTCLRQRSRRASFSAHAAATFLVALSDSASDLECASSRTSRRAVPIPSSDNRSRACSAAICAETHTHTHNRKQRRYSVIYQRYSVVGRRSIHMSKFSGNLYVFCVSVHGENMLCNDFMRLANKKTIKKHERRCGDTA